MDTRDLNIFPDIPSETEQLVQRKELQAKTPLSGFLSAYPTTGVAETLATPSKQIWDFLEELSIPADPNFNPENHLNELKAAGIPAEYFDGFLRAGSKAEFDLYKEHLQDDIRHQSLIKDSGASGIAATALTMALDPTNLLFLGAGPAKTRFGTLESVGLQETKLAGITSTAVSGAKIGGIAGGINYTTSPTGTWADIPAGMLFGLALGGGLGAFSKVERTANDVLHDARNTFSNAVQDGILNKVDPREMMTAPLKYINPEAMKARGSLSGAATETESLLGSTAQGWRETAQQWLAENNWSNKLEFPNNTKLAQYAQKMQKFIDKTPLASDWNVYANSKSSILNMHAGLNLESASGLFRNNRSTAYLMDYFENNLKDVNRVSPKFYADYAKKANVKFIDPAYHTSLRQQFNKELTLELNHRLHKGTPSPASSKEVRELADVYDKMTQKAAQYLKENGVEGADQLVPKSGWMRRVWNGQKMQEIIAANPDAKKSIAQTISNSYQKIYGFDAKDADIYAKAVVRGTMSRAEGIDTNLFSLLSGEGTSFLEQFLIDQGLHVDEVKKLVDRLAGVSADKKQPNYLKHRLEVDLSEAIPGTQYSLVDLVDTDVSKVYTRYAKRVAGDAALAANGIQNSQKRGIINAAKEELAVANDTSVPEYYVDNMFKPFEAGALVGEGLHPLTVMAQRLTHTALGASFGLTQIAETGMLTGAHGIEAFIKAAPKSLKSFFNGEKTPLVKELEEFSGPVGDMHVLHNEQFNFEMLAKDAPFAIKAQHYLNTVLPIAQNAVGHVSMFYKIHSAQVQIGTELAARKVAKLMQKNPDAVELRRLYDMGIDTQVQERLKKYFTDGTVKYNPDGSLQSHNFGDWNPKDVMDYRIALNRSVNGEIQRLMPGEKSLWWSTDMGSLFTQLKTFTLGTIQKQVLRGMMIDDPQLRMQAIHSMLFGAAVYTAKQISSGNDKNLDPISIAKGAFGLNNFTGYIPMFTDPLAGILGLDNLRFNHYGMTDVSTGIIPTPVALSTLNKMGHIPGSVFGLVTGDYNANDVQAMRTLPVFGNLPGMIRIWNSMKSEKNKED